MKQVDFRILNILNMTSFLLGWWDWLPKVHNPLRRGWQSWQKCVIQVVIKVQLLQLLSFGYYTLSVHFAVACTLEISISSIKICDISHKPQNYYWITASHAFRYRCRRLIKHFPSNWHILMNWNHAYKKDCGVDMQIIYHNTVWSVSWSKKIFIC